ncbi:carbohydrate-binding module family 13 protein [Wolfiporia cocos MD-104 SS10]|uniref:Carbohydrate-binding module family 13 protein n=1 Tax=Wolfiporia cocos (strain MD-104) TaxID=742152 RepID=A0A2H3JTB7_WOLCO|nr:carbohydrate-binding module family 13 protein [Wolfiporia cocos MD-104 SS10]
MQLGTNSIPNLEGTFALINFEHETAMDLSAADLRTVVGYGVHLKQNQLWAFVPSGRGYTIQTIWPVPTGPLYLTIESLNHDAAIVVSPIPAVWFVEFEGKEAIRVWWPNTDLVLACNGWSTMRLQYTQRGQRNQMWKFFHVLRQPDESISSNERTISVNITKPAETESVMAVCEDGDYVATTHTRTITVTTITTTKCSGASMQKQTI